MVGKIPHGAFAPKAMSQNNVGSEEKCPATPVSEKTGCRVNHTKPYSCMVHNMICKGWWAPQFCTEAKAVKKHIGPVSTYIESYICMI